MFEAGQTLSRSQHHVFGIEACRWPNLQPINSSDLSRHRLGRPPRLWALQSCGRNGRQGGNVGWWDSRLRGSHSGRSVRPWIGRVPCRERIGINGRAVRGRSPSSLRPVPVQASACLRAGVSSACLRPPLMIPGRRLNQRPLLSGLSLKVGCG